jgi:LemA protein
MVLGWIAGIALVLLVIIFIWYYNRFIVLENRIKNSEAQINVQLKKRADLVPSLVKVVKGYAKHEKSIMNDVTKARRELIHGKTLKEKVEAGDRLQDLLKSVFALAENYPNLRANENFLHLQHELAAIEDKVAYSRQYYNDSVLSLENASKKFPGVFFFRLYGRKRREYLQISESEARMPHIEEF